MSFEVDAGRTRQFAAGEIRARHRRDRPCGVSAPAERRGDGEGRSEPPPFVDVDRLTVLCILIHNKEQGRGTQQRQVDPYAPGRRLDARRHEGQHWQFTHPTKRGRVTVPHPNKEIPRGTVASIYRQAGWKA